MKNIKLLALLIPAFLMSFAVKGQGTDAGAVPFILITPDARSAAMGLTGTALEMGAYGIFHNPASNLFAEKSIGAGYSFSPWQREQGKGSNLHAVGAYYNIDGKNGVSLGFRHFTNQEVLIVENANDPGTSFRPKEMVLDLAYTRRIIDNLTAAVTVHYINSDLGDYNGMDKGMAVAFDIGLFYKRAIPTFRGADWSVGLSMSNVGMKIDYGADKYELPGVLKAGGAVNLPFSADHKLLCAVDLGYQVIPSDASLFRGGFGVEYNFLQYGILRGGYHFSDKKEGYGNFATVGCGVKAGPVRADFSYWITESSSVLKNTWAVSLGVYFK